MARPSRRPANAAGFTLLEVLVAVAILAMSLTSLLSSQMAGLRATNKARMLSTVAFLAEYQLIEIEWMLKEEGGWGNDDRTFEGDFSDQGWPSVSYQCVVDLIEMPDYTQLQAAADAADTDDGGGIGGYDVQDAGETAFDTLGMVWPIVKNAIENSIRKSWCTVRWTLDGETRKSQQDDTLCGESEFECMTVATFWTDPAALLNLPAAGGEVTEDDDLRDGGGAGGGGSGAGGSGRGGGGGGGKGAIGGGGLGPATPPSQRGGR